MRELGFRPDEVERADAVLIGHPHYGHISDAAQVARQTGASVVVHPLGADVLTRGGLDVDRIVAVTGQGDGDVLEFPEFTLRVIHGPHADLTHPEQSLSLETLMKARQVWERDEPQLSPEEEAYSKSVQQRGSWDPAVMTGAPCASSSMSTVTASSTGTAPARSAKRSIRTSGQNPGCDLGIVGFVGRPLVRRQLKEATMPLIEAYQPKVAIPCHHDDLYPVFIDMPTEPLKMRVHERLPAASTVQPVYVEPVTVSMKSGVIAVGDQ